jgi:type 1 glutamine amidotransferase
MPRNRLFAFGLAAAAVAVVTVGGLAVSSLSTGGAHAANAAAAADEKPIKALLVLGGCCHDYKAQAKLITEGVSARTDVEWTVAYDPDTGTKHLNPIYEKDDWYKGFDVVVHDECTSDVKDPAVIERILKPHREGLPAVHLHCSMHSYRSEGWPDKDIPWFQFTGIATTGHGPQEPIDVTYVDASSPITKGLENWTTTKEELYNNVRKPLATAHVLATGKQGNEEAVVVWTNLYGEKKTKVFGTTLGHNNATVGDPRYLDLITRGMLWSLDKLDDKHLKAVASANGQAAAGAEDAAVAEDDCACEGE